MRVGNNYYSRRNLLPRRHGNHESHSQGAAGTRAGQSLRTVTETAECGVGCNRMVLKCGSKAWTWGQMKLSAFQFTNQEATANHQPSRIHM